MTTEPMRSFMDRLRDRWHGADTLVCVGLDPEPAKFPAKFAHDPDAIFHFCRDIVDATAPYVCAFKPQIAHFAAAHAEEALRMLFLHIGFRYPHIPVILDSKRGDIGSTAQHYAAEAFDRYGADAVTVNPYLCLLYTSKMCIRDRNQEKARQKAIARELEWSRQNAKGGRSKGKARLGRLEELQSQDYQKRNETNEIFIPPGERLGNSVIEFKGVTKSFGDRLLIDNLDMLVPPGAIVGIIGPNGAGKSTLFKMITGQEKPDSGSINIGPTVNLAYVDQSRGALELSLIHI